MDKTVIAAASFYSRKYFFNPEFNSLPVEVKNEIKEMTVTAAERSRGIFTIGIKKGEIYLETGADQDDFNYDEIEGKLQIRKIENEKANLLTKLRLWHKLK